jgi:hypothetical protein
MGYYIGESDDVKELLQILEAGLATQTPAIMWGPPGIGKTDLVRAIARKHNLPLFILLASTMDPTDINGLPAIKRITIERPDGSKEEITVTEPTLQYWAEALIREGKGILFFDEANNAVPAVQSTLLSVLQGRIVGRHTLPNEIWMIAASNETADAADGWDLAPPMANRFLHIDVRPNLEDWYGGMIVNWGDDIDPNDKESYRNYILMQRQRTEVAGFVKQNPGLLLDMPKDSLARGKGWPSPRSWDAVARMLSRIPKPSATHHTLGVRSKIVEGLVGKAAAVAYEKYEKGLKLPPYEVVITAPDKIKWKELSAAETRLILDVVVVNVSPKNLEQTLQVFGAISTIGERTDIAASMNKALLNKVKPFVRSGQVNMMQLLPTMKKYAPFLKEAMID